MGINISQQWIRLDYRGDFISATCTNKLCVAHEYFGISSKMIHILQIITQKRKEE